MNSIWYEMGLRNGTFKGTVPAVFMNSAYRFFLDLKTRCRQSIVPGYTPSGKDVQFTFTGRDRQGRWHTPWTQDFYREFFTFGSVPMGTPVGKEFWESEKPVLTDEVLAPAEENILGEEIALAPSAYTGDLRLINDISWEKQRYLLIQKMRYCIIPLKILSRKKNYISSWTKWYEYLGNTGCVDRKSFYWGDHSQLHIKFPEYWTAGNTRCRIAVNARNLTSGYKVPVEGNFWCSGVEYITPPPPERDLWYSSSQLRIYGVVDLASHPEWQKYFDTETNQS